jgi:uncharacterized phage infection (PIP) family protein YhgE
MAWVAGMLGSIGGGGAAAGAAGTAGTAAAGTAAAGTAATAAGTAASTAAAAKGAGALTQGMSALNTGMEAAKYATGDMGTKGSMLNDGMSSIIGDEASGALSSLNDATKKDKDDPRNKAKSGTINTQKVGPGKGGSLSSVNYPTPTKFLNGYKVGGY